MKKIISIILCIATIFSCVSCCFAAPDEYASLIEGDESFDIGWPNFICDDENKEVFYTKGSLRTAEKYAEGILILCAPILTSNSKTNQLKLLQLWQTKQEN